MDTKKTMNKFSAEVRGRAVRMVQDHQGDHASQWAAIASIASKIGCTAESLRRWLRQAERDAGTRRVCADLAVLGVVAIAAFVPRPCANRLEFGRELSKNERSDEIAQPMAEPFTKVAGNCGLIGQEDRSSSI